MFSKTLASFSAILMTLTVFTGTVSVMNFAASEGTAREIQV